MSRRRIIAIGGVLFIAAAIGGAIANDRKAEEAANATPRPVTYECYWQGGATGSSSRPTTAPCPAGVPNHSTIVYEDDEEVFYYAP